jgi:hypothetical protein
MRNGVFGDFRENPRDKDDIVLVLRGAPLGKVAAAKMRGNGEGVDRLRKLGHESVEQLLPTRLDIEVHEV